MSTTPNIPEYTMSHYQFIIYFIVSNINTMYCRGCTSNLCESLKIFSTPDTAYNYFSAHQVFPENVQCTNCEAPAKLSIRLSTWRCQRVRHVNGQRQRCNFTRSLKINTWMAGTHRTLEQLGKLITYYLLLPPPHQDFIMNELKLTDKTVVRWSQIIREAELQWCVAHTPQTIGGPNTIVEIDEAAFGHRKYNRGREIATQWVFGGIQRGTRHMFFELVSDRTQETLMEIIHRRILPGTTVISDGWRAYSTISHEGKPFLPSSSCYKSLSSFR